MGKTGHVNLDQGLKLRLLSMGRLNDRLLITSNLCKSHTEGDEKDRNTLDTNGGRDVRPHGYECDTGAGRV